MAVDEAIQAVNDAKNNDEVTIQSNKTSKDVDNTELETNADKAPIKITLKIKPTRSSTSKDEKKDDKTNTPKQRPVRTEKSTPTDKERDDRKSHRRRNSRNKSLNGSNSLKDKSSEKKNDSSNHSVGLKEKSIDKKNDSSNNGKDKKDLNSKREEKANEKQSKADSKSVKDKIAFDDDTSLAVLARESKTNTGLPTISSVRSLSTTQQNSLNKNTEVITVSSDSSIFTPTSTDNVRNMKEAVNKLQKLRSGIETPVGRVGVRAFARMTSPERQKPRDDVEIEIKSEPIEFDDADRHSEKMDLMNAFHLRPVNPPAANLRGVRINKVVVAPVARKTTSKPPEIRVKAKKSFPQPRKADDGRSELNSKNSMVYIPIQPPSTQAPVRPTRPVTVNGTTNNQTIIRPQVSATSCIGKQNKQFFYIACKAEMT